MADIRELFKETTTEFMEVGLDVKLDYELGYSKYGYAKRRNQSATAGTDTVKRCRKPEWKTSR